MRRIFVILMASGFAAVLGAQATTITGLSVNSVIHEPSKTEAGPYLSSLQVVNPAYDSLQPTGEPQFLPLIGNGKGLHFLDSVSGEFYALGGTTTHDLCILTNNSGADVIVDLDYGVPNITPPSPGRLMLTSTEAAVNPAEAPQQASPDPTATLSIYGYDASAVSVPNGSSVAIFLLVTKWANYLDTSPRDYILTFNFIDVATGNPATFTANMTVPKAGDEEGGGCQASNSNLPAGFALVAGGAMAAIVFRRKLLEKARA